MSQGVAIVIEQNQWAKLGEEMARQGMGKDYISAEFKSILGKIGTKGKRILAGHTPVYTGFLKAAAGKKADRFPDRLGAYGLVGYLRPKYNKHQYWIIDGTKERRTKSGASRGQIKPKKPDPLEKTASDLSAEASRIFSDNFENAIVRGAKKMDAKFGNAWRQL